MELWQQYAAQEEDEGRTPLPQDYHERQRMMNEQSSVSYERLVQLAAKMPEAMARRSVLEKEDIRDLFRLLEEERQRRERSRST